MEAASLENVDHGECGSYFIRVYADFFRLITRSVSTAWFLFYGAQLWFRADFLFSRQARQCVLQTLFLWQRSSSSLMHAPPPPLSLGGELFNARDSALLEK
jgi:hypothetical protein